MDGITAAGFAEVPPPTPAVVLMDHCGLGVEAWRRERRDAQRRVEEGENDARRQADACDWR